MENDKKEKVLKVYEALNEDTCRLLTLSRISSENLKVANYDGNYISLDDELKEAVIRTVRSFAQARIVALANELEELMSE